MKVDYLEITPKWEKQGNTVQCNCFWIKRSCYPALSFCIYFPLARFLTLMYNSMIRNEDDNNKRVPKKYLDALLLQTVPCSPKLHSGAFFFSRKRVPPSRALFTKSPRFVRTCLTFFPKSGNVLAPFLLKGYCFAANLGNNTLCQRDTEAHLYYL